MDGQMESAHLGTCHTRCVHIVIKTNKSKALRAMENSYPYIRDFIRVIIKKASSY